MKQYYKLALLGLVAVAGIHGEEKDNMPTKVEFPSPNQSDNFNLEQWTIDMTWGKNEGKKIDGLFKTFQFFNESLNSVKKDDQATLQPIKDDFDHLLAKELEKNPDALTAAGPYGFTPAHVLAIEFLLLLRGNHWAGREAWKGQENALRDLFYYAFKKINTNKSVQVVTSINPYISVHTYLEDSGITKKSMTADEFIERFKLIFRMPSNDSTSHLV